jgi:hypothetical protein
MFAITLQVAKDWLRWFLTQRYLGERPFRDRFREYWYGTAREARGLRLLREWLSPEQLAQFERKGYFDVTGCDSGRRYRILHGTAMNIHEIDQTGQALVGWCFVPSINLVAGDVMLAQKIALETNECGALAVAKSFSPKEGGLNMFMPS